VWTRVVGRRHVSEVTGLRSETELLELEVTRTMTPEMAGLSLNAKNRGKAGKYLKPLDRRPVASSASVAGISARFLTVKTSDVLRLPRRRAALFHLWDPSGSPPPAPAVLRRSAAGRRQRPCHYRHSSSPN
jgi:hypothetical protein